jgi:hypothetical protein
VRFEHVSGWIRMLVADRRVPTKVPTSADTGVRGISTIEETSEYAVARDQSEIDSDVTDSQPLLRLPSPLSAEDSVTDSWLAVTARQVAALAVGSDVFHSCTRPFPSIAVLNCLCCNLG